jgi:hypothetical protein
MCICKRKKDTVSPVLEPVNLEVNDIYTIHRPIPIYPPLEYIQYPKSEINSDSDSSFLFSR